MKHYTPEEQEFIRQHQHRNPSELMLQAGRYPNLPVAELVKQIQARQKAAEKLPTWVSHPDVVFPVAVSVEQSSSEAAAAYKASLVSGELLVDLTGGFGVDSFYFAKRFSRVVHVEQNEELSELAAHNFQLLCAQNIQAVNSSAEDFLSSFEGQADVLYLDPARRGERSEKVHLLQDCEPDVQRLLPLLLQKSKAVLLKTSPMLDIDLALEQLGSVSQVWVVAVQNECKEVLYLIEPSAGQTERHAVNLLAGGGIQQIDFTKSLEDQAKVRYADPDAYLYEPNAAILKAGAYRSVAIAYGLHKLHPNSHLYTSATLVPDFPGRVFSCQGSGRYNKKELFAKLPSKKANITVRNFPESVAEIRKKTGIKEGGQDYLFFTTDMHQKPIVLYCRKATAASS
ncbi:THUMP-like domain-containing protein [Pontibacter roseus]|uniref:THUMP-like domain-containing protein n=1 Tax=Pontibacter roseus TaxID=336989 RepID=UPI0003637EFC|nr:class I SAM-dependent methyltransferase [Pontibacter roseus]